MKTSLIEMWSAPTLRQLAPMKNPAKLLFMAVFVAGLPSGVYAANPPAGSYQKTCAVQSFRDSVLTATCKPESSPNFRLTQIDIRACGPDVFNRDGGLQCYAKQGFGNGRAIPRGSYIDSCKDVIVTGDQKSISAQCKDGNGNYRATKISTSGCSLGKLDNDNGNLICRR